MRTLQATTMAAIAMILLLCIGGATMKGTTPDKEVAIMLANCQAAFKAGDLEKIMDCYSNDYTDAQGANKDIVRSDLEGMAAQGTLQSITIVELEEGAITVNGDNATVTPIVVDFPMGTITFRFTLKKETDGVWRLVSSDWLPEMVTKKPKVTKGLKESALLSPDNSVIEEKAPFPGYLYRPKDNAAHPGIIFLHGSDGGNGNFWHLPGTPPSVNVGENSWSPILARHYASLGYVVYALCYFDCMHHEGYDYYPPDELKDIDLLKVTYKAFLWLKNSDYVKNKKVAIWGGSRGAEQALVFASSVGKNKDNMNLTVPDAILSISPSDFVAGAFTKKQADYINNSTESDFKNFPTHNYSSWIFDGKKIKPNIPIEIEHYKGPVLITYFSADTIWGPSVHCENLAKRYSENNIPYVLIPFSKGKDVMEAVDKAKNNMDKNIFINFNKEKGHHYPMDMDSRSVMNNVIDLFLKTHLGD